MLGIVLFKNIIDNVLSIKLKNKILLSIKEMMVITISAQIVIIPIMMLNFNQVSIMFWLSNVLAAPIIAICIIAGFIVIFISLIQFQIAKVLAIPIIFLLKVLIFISKIVSNIPFSNLTVITPNISIIIAYFLVLTGILYVKRNEPKKYKIEKKIVNKIKKCLKKVVCVLAIITIISYGIKLKEQNMYIHFIDVGQGDATLIITSTGKKVLIDGGGTDGTYDIGNNVLIPYLLDRGIYKIDYVMISHFDSDHCKRYLIYYGKANCKEYNNI